MSTHPISGGLHARRIIDAGPAGVGADACPGLGRPIRELGSYLDRLRARCRTAKWFRSLFQVEVVQEIAADVLKDQQRQAAIAHRAEILDLEAAKLLEQGDRRRAGQLLRKSAELDHDISEALG